MFIVVTMFFGGGLIPTYLLIKSLGFIDSRWSLIIPGLISTYSMLILRNFFMSLPEELEDSAKIDGASDLRILFTIVIPLSKPILATLALWSAVGHWNAWFDAMLYIQDQSKTVLQILLRRIVITPEGDNLMTVPIEEQDAGNPQGRNHHVYCVADPRRLSVSSEIFCPRRLGWLAKGLAYIT